MERQACGERADYDDILSYESRPDGNRKSRTIPPAVSANGSSLHSIVTERDRYDTLGRYL